MGPVNFPTGPKVNAQGSGSLPQAVGVLQDFHGKVKGVFPGYGKFEMGSVPRVQHDLKHALGSLGHCDFPWSP